MFDPKIKIRRELYDKLSEVAKSMGVSVEEFVEKAVASELERALMPLEGELSGDEEKRVASQLKGLGYIE